VARATGFLHAQDRFFQMDLMRGARRANCPNWSARDAWPSPG
jgi:acyl-homoserine lactone acylase PvdQ